MATWTAQDLTRLCRAIASGALKVSYADGKSVEYRSLDDMIRLKKAMEIDLGISSQPIRKVAAHSKGIDAGSIDRSRFGWND